MAGDEGLGRFCFSGADFYFLFCSVVMVIGYFLHLLKKVFLLTFCLDGE